MFSSPIYIYVYTGDEKPEYGQALGSYFKAVLSGLFSQLGATHMLTGNADRDGTVT
jgi:hypothetical protein